MSGWQRLFALSVMLVGGAAFALWMIQKPSGDHYAAGCEDPTYATELEAKKRLGSNDYKEWGSATEARCFESLRAIASGEVAKQEMRAWRGTLQYGAIGLGVFFAIIYAVGYGLGWVWRGFFPAKAQKNER